MEARILDSATGTELNRRGANPALVMRDWGLSLARVKIDDQLVPAGKDLRLGSALRLEGDDLAVWIRKDATSPLRITVAPAGLDPAR